MIPIHHALLILAILLLPLPVAAAETHAHEQPSDIRCIDCHLYLPLRDVPPPPFREGIASLCRQCHQNSGIGPDIGQQTFLMHPMVAAFSRIIPKDMPLDRQGRMTCITCHYFHPRRETGLRPIKFMLRRPPGKNFCIICHKKPRPD